MSFIYKYHIFIQLTPAFQLCPYGSQSKYCDSKIYYYYKNKSELLLDCYTRTLDICESLIEEAEAQGGTSLDKLCYFTRELIYLNCAHGSIAIVSELNSVPDAAIEGLRKRNTALTENLLSLTKNGVADGSMRSDIGKPTIYFIMGGVNWIPRWHREDGTMSAEDIANSYTEFLLRGVAALLDELLDDAEHVRIFQLASLVDFLLLQRGAHHAHVE